MAAENFEAALARVLAHEGGYVDHPDDPGGATNLGITRATLAAWRGRPVDKAEVRALTRAEAAAIYRARYWDAVAGDALAAGLDLAVFDFAVNSGPVRAAKLLQGLIGVEADGVIGPRTLAALAGRPAAPLIRALCARRLAFLRALPGFAVFGRGWSRRVAAIEAAGLALASPFPHGNTETAMDSTKSILSSRTIWANLVGLAALGASLLGYDVAGLDAGALTDALLQGVAAASFVASSLFRVLAKQRLAA